MKSWVPLNLAPRPANLAEPEPRSLTSPPDRHDTLRQIKAAQRKLRRGALARAHRIFEINLPRLARQQRNVIITEIRRQNAQPIRALYQRQLVLQRDRRACVPQFHMNLDR